MQQPRSSPRLRGIWCLRQRGTLCPVQQPRGSRRLRGSTEEHETIGRLVQEALASYGHVGIFDPERLAEIDFLNQPELLVELVSRSRKRESRALKPDMQLLTEVTTKWMQLKVDQNFPPLTPHHTQAFTVLMMCKFFHLYLGDGLVVATDGGVDLIFRHDPIGSEPLLPFQRDLAQP